MAIREDRERASRGQEQEGGTRVHPSIHRERRAIKVESERERGLVFFGRKAAMTNGMDGRREEPHKRCASYSTLTLGSGKVRVGPRHRRTILTPPSSPHRLRRSVTDSFPGQRESSRLSYSLLLLLLQVRPPYNTCKWKLLEKKNPPCPSGRGRRRRETHSFGATAEAV